MKINLGHQNKFGPLVGFGDNGEKDTVFPTLTINVEKGKEKLLKMLARKGKAVIVFEPQTVTVGGSEYAGDYNAGQVTLKVYSIEVESAREKMMNADSDGALEDFMDTSNMH